VRSRDNAEAEFHGVQLPYRGKVRGAGGGAVYGARDVMAGEGEFEVTFRVKDCIELAEWTWLPRVHAARVVGMPPRDDTENWSEKFKVTTTLHSTLIFKKTVDRTRASIARSENGWTTGRAQPLKGSGGGATGVQRSLVSGSSSLKQKEFRCLYIDRSGQIRARS